MNEHPDRHTTTTSSVFALRKKERKNTRSRLKEKIWKKIGNEAQEKLITVKINKKKRERAKHTNVLCMQCNIRELQKWCINIRTYK